MRFRPFPRLSLLASLLLLLVSLSSSPAWATPYLDELVAAARHKQLAERPEWRALLHYQPRFQFLALRSLADSADFFNAPDGERNPQGELEATLAAFFSDVAETETQQNPQCRFIARYHWLQKELAFDPQRLPPQPCQRFAQWHEALNPAAVTLVFPAAYLNNPASMYGHTFLRIDTRGQTGRSQLLGHAINYAASTDETNGVVFAMRGLFGGYAGNFSLSPYYVKVGEYNDLENRDMWEYTLSLQADEVDRLLMHAWELGPTRFDYFFVDENCSYHLLSLLDVARPGLNLVDRFGLWAIPSETVRAVAEHPGLVRQASYRPARSTLLRHRMNLLDEPQIALARQLADGDLGTTATQLSTLPADTQAQVLDLGFEYLEYSRLRGDIANRDAAPRLRALLGARSRIDVSDVPAPPTPAVRPEHGHGASRISLGAGARTGHAYQELRLRPVYHDLLDRQDGYIRGAQIEFMHLIVRHDNLLDQTRLEAFKVADIVSLPPRDALLKPMSWRIAGGLQRADRADGSRPLLAHLDGGAGMTWGASPRAMAYLLGEASLQAAHVMQLGYSAGGGASAGLMLDPTPGWRILAHGRAVRYAAGELHTRLEAGLDQRLALTRDTALRLEARWQQDYDRFTQSTALYLDLHF